MFIHLHTHSAFSFLDGGSLIDSLVARAAELGMPALALTDHDNLCGAVKFHARARQHGIKPVQGVEVTLAGGHHLTLLARGPEGYRSLCRLLTRAHLEHPRRRPQVTPANLQENSHGLIALSGCRRGRVPGHILARRYQQARQAAREYLQVWGREGFFLELQDPYLPGNTHLNARLAELGEELGVGLVATNNVHYTWPDEFRVHDILTCVRTLTRVHEVHPERPLNGENYLKTAEQMEELFQRYPQALANTWRIAEQCSPALDLESPHFPRFPLPAGQTAAGRLEELTLAGAAARYGSVGREVRERLRHELDIINALGYADYFLVVEDIVRFARGRGIRFAGRGSAADSLVAYCLGITEVDSLARGLLFERFMSLERAQKPDIDIDFDARYRDEVARYVYRRYGDEHVASVCTYNTFRARSALRDLGKALGLAEEEIGPLARRLPWVHADRIRHALERWPELRGSALEGERFALLLELCEKVAGFPRFLGTHLGGLVISRQPLADITPLQQAAKGVTITQFDKDDVEELGLIKLDLLSLRTMSAIDDAVASIRRSGADFDYERIPLDDRATYQLINSGRTIGVFQLESPAQRALQARLGASHMEDIVASVAIIRPGPIKGNMVEPYIARRQGKEPVSFLHPKLEAILGKTYGVILFQEQVIEVATAIANFTPGEADGLRRVMTHARSHRAMEEIGEVFVARAVANGVEREQAEEIFRCIAGYASYGFCEAHAAAFATTSFKTAYLLRHFPAEFYAAILSNQPMGYYPPHIIGNEARRRGIAILPPHLNLSGEKFEVEGKGIRIPLTRIKGLSREGVAGILARRPFSSLEDLVARTELARDELESLIRCGALDSLDGNRRRLLVLLPACLQARQAGPGQGGLDFAPAATAGLELPDFSEAEKRRDEFELLGMDVRGHVMEGFRRRLQAAGFLSSRQLAALPAGGPVRVAGMLFRPHRPPTRSGRVTVFMSLEDEFGLIEVTVFEDVYQRCGHRIFAPQHGPLVVEGMAQRRGNAVGVVARQVWRWQEAFPGGE